MAQKSKSSKSLAHNKSALVAALVVFVSLSAAGARQIVSATNKQLDTVQRDLEATSALSAPSAGFENYLLVGSDTREGLTKEQRKLLKVGSTKTAAGSRSDTMLIVHISKDRNKATIISIPRDLNSSSKIFNSGDPGRILKSPPMMHFSGSSTPFKTGRISSSMSSSSSVGGK